MRRSTIPSVALSASLVAGLVPFGALAQEPPQTSPVGTLSDRITAAIAVDATTLPGDVASSREYVAARVGYEDYDGVLKGAVGAYLTGTANGADQALLLDELIDPTIETRFALCAPDDALATELRVASSATATSRGLALDHLDEIRARIDDPDLVAGISEVLELRSTLKMEAAQAADQLSNELYDAGYVAPRPEITSSREHVWLQALVDGEWVDQDTTTPDGMARCEPDETVEVLNELFEHWVRFVVVAEQRIDDVVSTSELLEAGFPTAELAASRVSLLFGEPAGVLTEADPASDRATYTPVLRIDGETVAATESVGLPRLATDLGSGLGEAVEGIGGFLEDMPGGTDEEDESAGGGLFGGGDDDSGGLFGEVGLPGIDAGPEPAAMWLDIELLAPNGDLVTARTTLFDRIGFGARAAGNSATAELAGLDEVSGEYAPMSTLWQIGLLLGEASAAEVAEVEPFDGTSIDGYAAQLDAQLRTFAAIHRDMGGAGTFPALLTAAVGPTMGADGQPVTALTFDALHVPARGPSDDRSAARDALAVLAAEQMLAGIAGDTDGSAADSAAVLAQAYANGTEFVSLAPGDTLQGVTASTEALVRMQARLDDGFALLAPERPVVVDGEEATAWWTVDPVSGVVRDEHESGLHAESAEYSITTSRSISMMDRFRRLGCSIARPVAGVALVLFLATGAGGGSPLYTPLSAVSSAASKRAESEAARKAAEKAACALG